MQNNRYLDHQENYWIYSIGRRFLFNCFIYCKDFYFLCRLAEEIVNQDGDHSVIQCLDQVRLIFQSSQIDACFFFLHLTKMVSILMVCIPFKEYMNNAYFERYYWKCIEVNWLFASVLRVLNVYLIHTCISTFIVWEWFSNIFINP